MNRDLARLRRDWTVLGSSEPLWAVCVDPAKRAGGWEDTEFLDSGVAEVRAALARLGELGVQPSRGHALDFGCGAGRLAHALAREFDAVVGVDISEPMLAEARRLDPGHGRVTFLRNDATDLGFLEAGSFDLVYCDLVLQHLPPDLARGYLVELVRVLRPGGALVLGMPARVRWTVKGLVFRCAPQPLIRLGQRLVLGYPAPMRMHTMSQERVRATLAGRGVSVRAADEYWAGDHWQHLRYFAVRDGAEPGRHG